MAMCGNPTAPVAAITEEFRKNFLRLNIDSYKTPDFPRKFKPKRLLLHSGPVVRISPMKACLWLLVALLGTPVIDDVTIYYTAGTRYLYYEIYGGGL